MTAGKSLLKSRRFAVLIVVAIVISLAVPLLIGGRESVEQIRNLPPETYLALFAIICVSGLARSLKLQLLMARLGARVPFGRAVTMALAIDFAFIATPGGVGGYAANIYFGRRAGLSASGATTLTAVDQFLDLAFFALALPLAALSLVLMNLSITLSLLALGASTLMIGFAVAIFATHGHVIDWLCGDNVIVRRWPRLKARQQTLRAFTDNVKLDARLLIAGPPTTTAALIAATALQWLTRYGVLWAALALLGHAVPFALTLMAQSLILHAAMWTGVPSGGGGAELGLSAALLSSVPSATIGTALILWRLATFHLCLAAGLVCLASLARWRGARATPSENAA